MHGSAQTGPIHVTGVSEPPEMMGPAEVLPTMSEADKAFWDVLKQSGSNGTEVSLPALDQFLQEYPSYADGYYWRATAEACGNTHLNLPKAKADIQAALTHEGNGSSTFQKGEAFALLAKIESADGRRTSALNLLEKAIRVDLNSADDIFNIKGVAPETKSEFCTWNLSDLHLLAKQAPNDWRPLALEGLYYQFFTTFNESYYPQASAAFRKAALMNTRTPIVPYLIGELHKKEAFWTKKAWSSNSARDDMYGASIRSFTKSIQLDSDFEPAYAARAEAYLDLKRNTLAIKDFGKVLSVNPDDTTAHSDRGIAYADIGHYFAAISDFGEAIRAMKSGDSYLPDDYENRADAYVKVQNYRSAIEDYSSAIRLRLENQVILLSLAQFRGLYPEYSAVPDDMLLRKLNSLFAPQYKADAFKKLMTKENGKWGVSLLNDLYEKRGDAYLSIGDYGRGILDFQRIFTGMPDYGKSTERWRGLGAFGHEQKFYLDVKASEPLSKPYPRLWVKRVGGKQSEVMEFQLDCLSRRLRQVSEVIYDTNNNVVGESSAGENWSDVTPDTLGEQLWSGVCQEKP